MAHAFCRAILRSELNQAKQLGVTIPKGLTALKASDGKQYFIESKDTVIREYVKADCAWEAKANYLSQLIAKHIPSAIAQFPATFSLRGFPGKIFRISETASYISEGQILLYTQVQDGDKWLDFAKGTVEELKREVIS